MSRDWICPICDFKIFGHKTECFKCKSKNSAHFKIQVEPPENSNHFKIQVEPPENNNYTIQQVFDESNEIINNINKRTELKLKQRNEDIQRAINEGLPELHYVNMQCLMCKNGETKTHNCWKYS